VKRRSCCEARLLAGVTRLRDTAGQHQVEHGIAPGSVEGQAQQQAFVDGAKQQIERQPRVQVAAKLAALDATAEDVEQLRGGRREVAIGEGADHRWIVLPFRQDAGQDVAVPALQQPGYRPVDGPQIGHGGGGGLAVDPGVCRLQEALDRQRALGGPAAIDGATGRAGARETASMVNCANPFSANRSRAECRIACWRIGQRGRPARADLVSRICSSPVVPAMSARPVSVFPSIN